MKYKEFIWPAIALILGLTTIVLVNQRLADKNEIDAQTAWNKCVIENIKENVPSHERCEDIRQYNSKYYKILND